MHISNEFFNKSLSSAKLSIFTIISSFTIVIPFSINILEYDDGENPCFTLFFMQTTDC